MFTPNGRGLPLQQTIVEVIVRLFVMAAVTVAVTVAVSAATGCSVNVGVNTKPRVAREDLAKDISERLAKAGQTPKTVTCKDDLLGEDGRTTRCEVALSEINVFEPIIEVTGVEGETVNYRMTPALSKEQLEKSVSALIEESTGTPAGSVSCESGLEGQEGNVVHCDVDAGGVTLRRAVEVSRVDGLMMDYRLVPMLTRDEVATSLLDQLQDKVGERPDSAECSDDLLGKTGNAIECLVVAGPETTTFAVTVTSVDGNEFNYHFEPKS
jgi:hypothetical protein